VTELTTSNIGWAKNGRAFTPTADAGILHGITRKLLLQASEVEEGSFKAEDLLSADEVFAISTFKEITPIVELGSSSGSKTFQAGPVTLKLQGELRSQIQRKLAEERPVF
jgi:4-amino-4-deoxychorismate lyase